MTEEFRTGFLCGIFLCAALLIIMAALVTTSLDPECYIQHSFNTEEGTTIRIEVCE